MCIHEYQKINLKNFTVKKILLSITWKFKILKKKYFLDLLVFSQGFPRGAQKFKNFGDELILDFLELRIRKGLMSKC